MEVICKQNLLILLIWHLKFSKSMCRNMADGQADPNIFDFILTLCLTEFKERLLLTSVKFRFRAPSDI